MNLREKRSTERDIIIYENQSKPIMLNNTTVSFDWSLISDSNRY